jgi:DNA primase
MEYAIDVLKQLNFVDFLSQHYNLSFKKSGSGYVCLSPFTQEKTPSFFVRLMSDGHWLFKDFSSGHSGSIFDFVQIKENLPDFSSAFSYIRKSVSRFCCNIESSDKDTELVKTADASTHNVYSLYDKFRRNDPSVCRQYLIDRGISEPLVDTLISQETIVHNRYKGVSYCCFAVHDPDDNLCCLDNHQIEGNSKFVLGRKHAFSLDWAIIASSSQVFICEGSIDYLSMKTLEGNNIVGIALLGNQLNFDLSLLSRAGTIISALDTDPGGFSAFIDVTDELPGREYKAYDLKGCKDPNELLQMKKNGKRGLTADQKLQLYNEFQRAENKTQLAERWGINRTYLYEIVDDCEKTLLDALCSRKTGRKPKGRPETLSKAWDQISLLEKEKEYEATLKEQYHCSSEFLKLRLKWAQKEAAEVGETVDDQKKSNKIRHLKKKRKKRR